MAIVNPKIKPKYWPQYSAYVTAKLLLLGIKDENLRYLPLIVTKSGRSISQMQLKITERLVNHFEKKNPGLIYTGDKAPILKATDYKDQNTCALNTLNNYPTEQMLSSYYGGFKQVIHIGCGLMGIEMQNAMIGEKDGLKVFAFDLPGVIDLIKSALKEEYALDRCVSNLDNLHYDSINLLTDNFIEKAKANKIDFNAPTKIVIAGVFPYIDKEKCSKLMQDINNHFSKNTALIISLSETSRTIDIQNKVQEKYKFTIRSDNVKDFFESSGLNIESSLTFDKNTGVHYYHLRTMGKVHGTQISLTRVTTAGSEKQPKRQSNFIG